MQGEGGREKGDTTIASDCTTDCKDIVNSIMSCLSFVFRSLFWCFGQCHLLPAVSLPEGFDRLFCKEKAVRWEEALWLLVDLAVTRRLLKAWKDQALSCLEMFPKI